MKDRDNRFFKEAPRTSDLRSPARIDADRILYSPHFARLAEVTQVRTLAGDFLVHNRLTHSLKVAQVARSIADVLKRKQPELAEQLELDPAAAEAAGLAHDLGHPPFGHIAEEELNDLVSNTNRTEGYEGNAQSFRIVTALSVSDAAPLAESFVAGLNLTKATLNAILKYPWRYRENAGKKEKWGAYGSENKVFEWVRHGQTPQKRSIEAEIMDWADDITYAIHDMVDFYCAGLIPLHLLVNRTSGGDLARREWSTFFDAVCEQESNQRIRENRPRFEAALENAFGLAGVQGPFDGSQQQSSTVWRFSSELISRYVNAISMVDPAHSPDGRSVHIRPAEGDQTTILKQLTWHYVIRRSDLATRQHGQRKIIRDLFRVYKDAIAKKKWELFPVGFAQLVRNDRTGVSPERWAADYISGLTERQIFDLYKRLSGHE